MCSARYVTPVTRLRDNQRPQLAEANLPTCTSLPQSNMPTPTYDRNPMMEIGIQNLLGDFHSTSVEIF